MKKLSNILILFLLSILFLPLTLQAGNPWTQAKGAGFSQLSFNYIRSDQLFHKDLGTLQLNRFVTDATLQTYLEYGITDKLTVLGVLPFKFTSTSDAISENTDFNELLSAGSFNQLGNISIAAKYGLITNKSIVAATQVRLDLPSKAFDANTGLRTGYNAVGVSPSLSVGYGTNHFFASAEIGLTFRTNKYSSAFFGNAEFGYNHKNRTYIILVVDATRSFFNENRDNLDGNALQTGLFVNNQHYFVFGLKLLHNVTENLGFGVSAYGAAIYSHQLAKFPSVGANIYWTWD
ncbi:MAG: hypothetical protein ACPG5B_07010 [Chitinophagales bacterium]